MTSKSKPLVRPTGVDYVEVYQDADGQWRWRRMRDGQMVATPGVAFSTSPPAVRAARRGNPDALDDASGVKIYFEGKDTPL